MATMLFFFGLLTGLVIGWLILAFWTYVTIKKRKKAAAKPLNHANDIPNTLVTLVLFGSYFSALCDLGSYALA